MGATSPQRGDVLKNTATFEWAGVLNGPTDKSVSDIETITVAEPNLTIKKYVNNADAQNAGSAVNLEPGATANYRLDIRHPGGTNSSAAHDVVVTDVVPTGLVAVTPTLPIPAGVTVTPNVVDGVTTLTWRIASVAPGTTVSLNYTATLAARPHSPPPPLRTSPESPSTGRPRITPTPVAPRAAPIRQT